MFCHTHKTLYLLGNYISYGTLLSTLPYLLYRNRFFININDIFGNIIFGFDFCYIAIFKKCLKLMSF